MIPIAEKTHAQTITARSEFTAGVLSAVPIMVGYLPIAVAFGMIAQQAGIPPLLSVCMSALVYAGASQFMAVNMLSAGAGTLEIVLATFVLNFRHFVMGLSLMNKLKKMPAAWKMAVSSGITDETFAVASLQKETIGKWFLAGLVLTSYTTWVVGTLIGGLLSQFIPPSISESMSVALYAMFIGLLIPAVRDNAKWGLIALVSMGLNTVLGMFLSSGWSIVLSTVLGGMAGVWLRRRKKG
ncbi:AzlC family ABC transporter permease [Polycladomyces zharkentensis]